MNLFIITGNLGADVEVKTHNQKQVLNFSVAVTKKYRDNATNQEVTETIWVRCSWWAKSEKIAQYLKKGQQVLVEGEAKVSAYLNGTEAKGSLECFVHRLELMGGKPSGESAQNNRTEDTEHTATEADDLPF